MPDRAFGVTVPADSRYLKVIRAFFKPVMDEQFEGEAGKLILALDESCSNVVKHRSGALDGGLVHVRLEVLVDRIRFRVGDFCGLDDIDKIKPRDLADVRPGGLGTHFVSEIMDRVGFEPEPNRPGRMALVMEKSIPLGKEQDGDADRDA